MGSAPSLGRGPGASRPPLPHPLSDCFYNRFLAFSAVHLSCFVWVLRRDCISGHVWSGLQTNLGKRTVPYLTCRKEPKPTLSLARNRPRNGGQNTFFFLLLFLRYHCEAGQLLDTSAKTLFFAPSSRIGRTSRHAENIFFRQTGKPQDRHAENLKTANLKTGTFFDRGARRGVLN